MANNAGENTRRPLAVNFACGLIAVQLSSVVVTGAWAIWTPELVALSTPIGEVAGSQHLVLISLVTLAFATVVTSRLWKGHGWAWSAALGISFTVLYARTLLLGTGAVLVGEGIVLIGAIGDICLLVLLVFPSVRRWVDQPH